MREDERTTERGRWSRGELFATGEREECKCSLLTREERGGAFSCIFVRVLSSFLSCGLSEDGLCASSAGGRFVALKAEDLRVVLVEERGRVEKLVGVFLANE